MAAAYTSGMELLLAEDDELNGQHALCYLAQYELEDYTLYIMQNSVPNASFGATPSPQPARF